MGNIYRSKRVYAKLIKKNERKTNGEDKKRSCVIYFDFKLRQIDKMMLRETL